MKKILILIAAITLALTLSACTKTVTAEVEVEVPMELAVIPDVVDMTNVDEFLGRPDVQYVDLRNFDDKMNSGYISGFEMIPFFDYLEYSNILVNEKTWVFDATQVKDEASLKALFDADKTIFLMCGSGTRAGYVKDALESLGYTKVYNVGGIGGTAPYAGTNKVFGDGTYNLTLPAVGEYTPGVYYAVDPVTQYTASIIVGANGAIENVVFDAMYNGSTKNTLDTAYTLGSGNTWKSEAEALAAYVLANQGWGDIELTVNELPTTAHHFMYIDTANSPDAVAGVSIGAEGFVMAWNLAIAKASEAGTGVIADVTSSFEYYTVHEYTIGENQYYGYVDGYFALITVDVNGDITNVVLDAIHTVRSTGGLISLKQAYDLEDYKMNLVLNDNGTALVDTDDYYEVAEGKLSWWQQADALADAMVTANGWDTSWTLTDGDMDAIAGVSIGVENWKLALEEAQAKIPTT